MLNFESTTHSTQQHYLVNTIQKVIGNTIDSILASDYDGALELIVVADKSTYGSLVVIVEKSLVHKFRVIAQSVNMGKRHALAAGIRTCSGDVLVFVDIDAVLAVDAIKNLVQPFVDGGVFCVSGSAVVSAGSFFGYVVEGFVCGFF